MRPYTPRKARYTEPDPANYIYNGLRTRVCSKCGRSLPEHPDFYQKQYANRSRYFRGECRACGIKADKKKNAENPRGRETNAIQILPHM